jgi:hypothetical protein
MAEEGHVERPEVDQLRSDSEPGVDRPWAAILARYFEAGMSKPDTKDSFDFGPEGQAPAAL